MKMDNTYQRFRRRSTSVCFLGIFLFCKEAKNFVSLKFFFISALIGVFLVTKENLLEEAEFLLCWISKE